PYGQAGRTVIENGSPDPGQILNAPLKLSGAVRAGHSRQLKNQRRRSLPRNGTSHVSPRLPNGRFTLSCAVRFGFDALFRSHQAEMAPQTRSNRSGVPLASSKVIPTKSANVNANFANGFSASGTRTKGSS